MDFLVQQLDFKNPHIMGVLNVTPDSFSDGGRFVNIDLALDQALNMIDSGASIIDVGGESTRPGATPVFIENELDRVIPLIERLRSISNVVISIDTSKPEVMRQAVNAGASLINDVYALRQDGALEMAAMLDVPICLMHMQKAPNVMQDSPEYKNILDEINDFFVERISACSQVGIAKERLILDPGFGFGKTLEHNLILLANLSIFKQLGCPILAGLSRKSMLGLILDKEVDERLYAGLSAAVIAAIKGASILRVHDVAETMDALAVVKAVQQYSNDKL